MWKHQRHTPDGMVGAIALLGIALSALVSPARADLLVYDGFKSGGSSPNPAAGEYNVGADGTGRDFSDDQIQGQSPDTTGFSSTAWGGAGEASSVYWMAQQPGLTYTDSQGDALVQAPGRARHHHDHSPQNKDITRATTGFGAGAQNYFSVLVQIDSSGTWSSTGEASVLFSPGGGNNTSITVGVNGSRQITAETDTSLSSPGEGSATDATARPLAEPILLVGKLTDGAGGLTEDDDQLDVFINPDLGAEPSSADLTIDSAGDFFPADTGSLEFDELELLGNLEGDDLLYFDEFRYGESYGDVTSTAIPAPASAALLAPAGLALLRRRRR